MNYWHRLGIVGACAALGLGAAACGSSDNASTSSSTTGQTSGGGGQTLNVGYVGGFTGILAPYDGGVLQGLKVAVADINSRAGADGTKIKLTTRDSRSEPAEAVAAAQELVSQGVDLLITPCDSDPSLAAGAVAQKAGIPALSSCATTPTLPQNVGDFMFLSVQGDNAQSTVLANYARDQGYKTAYLLGSPDSGYTEELPRYFGEVFKANGGKVVGTGTFQLGGQSFDAQVAKIQQLSPQPDVIMTSAYLPDFPVFIKKLRAAGVKVPVLGVDALDAQATIDAAGPAANGVVFTTHAFPTKGSPLADFYAHVKENDGQAGGVDLHGDRQRRRDDHRQRGPAGRQHRPQGAARRDRLAVRRSGDDGHDHVRPAAAHAEEVGGARQDRQRPLHADQGGAVPGQRPGSVSGSPDLLTVEDLQVSYGPVTAVRSLSLKVGEGEIVALLGPNGAGKTSTMAAIMRLVRPRAGRVTFAGASLERRPPEAIVRSGLTLTPEGRHVFEHLTVDENMRLGAVAASDRAWVKATRAEMLERFPRLAERAQQLAGTLSGGEQQQLAIVRSLLSRPRLLMLDEPSLGLAPIFVKSVLELVAELPKRGVSVLLVEQNTHVALKISDRAYVLARGELVGAGTAAELRGGELERAYLGLASEAAA